MVNGRYVFDSVQVYGSGEVEMAEFLLAHGGDPCQISDEEAALIGSYAERASDRGWLELQEWFVVHTDACG